MYCCKGEVQEQKEDPTCLPEADINEFKQGHPEALKNWKDDLNSVTHLLSYDIKYEIPSENLVFDKSKVLGHGEFGYLLKGSIKNPQDPNQEIQQVAIKTIYPHENVQHFKLLLSELKIMAYVGRHENLVSLIAACTRNIRNRELMVAIDFCNGGSLLEYIKKHAPSFRCAIQHFKPNLEQSHNRNGNLNESCTTSKLNPSGDSVKFSTRDLLEWAIQIATGMEFLASKQIIHGDIATRNILLDQNLVAKIGDFGLSRYLHQYSKPNQGTEPLLPTKYLSMDSLRGWKISFKSDVWDFGILLWQVFSLGETADLHALWIVNKLKKPIHASDQLYQVMLKCWRLNSEVRPSFETLLNEYHLRSSLLFCQKCLAN